MCPDLMQRVQARILRTDPSVWVWRTDWRLGNQTRLVLLLAWLTLFPTWGVLPQIAHFLLMSVYFLSEIIYSFRSRIASGARANYNLAASRQPKKFFYHIETPRASLLRRVIATDRSR
jgi:hypothetical protein